MQIFFSGGIIMPALRPPHTVPEGDDRLIQVRARRIVHLRRLKARYLPELGDIIEIKGTDYEYRAYCTHEQLASALALMALEIDYVKSKSQAMVQYNDKELYDTNNAVWGTIYARMSTHKVFSRSTVQHTSVSSRWDVNRVSAQRPLTPPTLTENSYSRRDPWARVSDLVDTEEAVVAEVPLDWDDQVPAVTRFPNGHIDHSYCDHGSSKAARRRCRRLNR